MHLPFLFGKPKAAPGPTPPKPPAPPYRPPTKVKTLEIPYKVLVLKNDPEFEQMKRKEPFYEFSGRKFEGNTAMHGAYSDVPNER